MDNIHLPRDILSVPAALIYILARFWDTDKTLEGMGPVSCLAVR